MHERPASRYLRTQLAKRKVKVKVGREEINPSPKNKQLRKVFCERLSI